MKALIWAGAIAFLLVCARAQDAGGAGDGGGDGDDGASGTGGVAAAGVPAAGTVAAAPALFGTCKEAISKLKIDYKGSTVFCPSDQAFFDLAGRLGYTGIATAPAQSILYALPDDAQLQIMSFHVHPSVRPASSFPTAARTRLETALATVASGAPDTALTIVRSPRGGVAVRHTTVRVEDDPSKPEAVQRGEAAVIAADLSFDRDGVFSAGGSHVVHVIDEVLVPRAAGASLRAFRAQQLKGSP